MGGRLRVLIMTIVVTGGAGQLGRAVIAALAERGIDISDETVSSVEPL